MPVMSRVMELYQPSAIVLQCGADSLSGDRSVGYKVIFSDLSIKLLLTQIGLLQPDAEGSRQVCGVHEEIQSSADAAWRRRIYNQVQLKHFSDYI